MTDKEIMAAMDKIAGLGGLAMLYAENGAIIQVISYCHSSRNFMLSSSWTPRLARLLTDKIFLIKLVLIRSALLNRFVISIKSVRRG